jgi:putative heme iron utilization protein
MTNVLMSYADRMELKQAQAQAQSKLAHLRQRRESLAAELAQVDGELEEAVADEAVLSRWAERYESVAATVPAQEATDWRSLSRMVAVERVLLEANEPLSPTNVNRALLDHGRDDLPSHVHAALGHLKGRNRATQAERGLWIHPSKSNGQSAEVTSATL